MQNSIWSVVLHKINKKNCLKVILHEKYCDGINYFYAD